MGTRRPTWLPDPSDAPQEEWGAGSPRTVTPLSAACCLEGRRVPSGRSKPCGGSPFPTITLSVPLHRSAFLRGPVSYKRVDMCTFVVCQLVPAAPRGPWSGLPSSDGATVSFQPQLLLKRIR